MYPKIEKMHIGANFTAVGFAPKYIVLHDTGNSSKSAGALAHQRYFCDKIAQASYNYICDDNRIIECVKPGDAAWHCGVGRSGVRKDGKRTDITNYTSVGVSYCINSGGERKRAIENAAYVCALLCEKLSLTELSLVRHFDSSGKLCPSTMYNGTWDEFFAFRQRVGALLREMRDNAQLVHSLAKKGYISDESYWLDVLNGKKTADMRWLRVLLGRLAA